MFDGGQKPLLGLLAVLAGRKERKFKESIDLQVNLKDKHERDRQSHEIALEVRPVLADIGERYGASVKVVEVPPGPPVMAPLVAEIYGPDATRAREIARDLQALVIGGWPLGYWIAAQGAVLVFIGIVVVYGWAMNRFERQDAERLAADAAAFSDDADRPHG